MIINKDVIAKLKPRKESFDNYIKHYGDKTHIAKEFMGLKNISHNDKIWVSFRLMPKANITKAAADIAELVLSIFEAKYPKDKRPRLAIEAARTGINVTDAAYAAYAAADADADAAVCFASPAYPAYAAAYAAIYAADASYAYAVYAAAYAADTAARAANSTPNIEKQIRTIILKYLK